MSPRAFFPWLVDALATLGTAILYSGGAVLVGWAVWSMFFGADPVGVAWH